jgi:P4 family phage/plasmid primase-like protien
MSARPTVSVSYDVIPQQMRIERRWVLWRDTAGRKRPFTVVGTSADSTDPATWSTFEAAVAAFRSGTYTGLGFVLGDGFAGIDLDDVRDPKSGELHPEAAKLIEISGSYAEVSPSGTGVKIFGMGQWAGFLPGLVQRREAGGAVELRETAAKNRRPFADGEIEVYCDQRYFTVTGQRIGGGEFCDLSPAFEVLRAEYSGRPIAEKAQRQKPAAPAAAAPTTHHTPTVLVADVNPLLGDDQIIAIASRSKNGDAFTALWNGDLTAYDGDHSRADLTLCQYLAFYTHNDPARLDRLFRRSKLFRDKWERADYRNRTIMQAISSCRKFWDPSNVVPYDNPHRLAERFLEENPTLKYLNETYYIWCDGAYLEVRPSIVRGELTNLVKREFEAGYQEAVAFHASQQDPKKKPPRLEPVTVTVVNNVMQALAGLCTINVEPPCWIDDVDGPDPSRVVSFRNGLLDVETGEFRVPTPAFFTLNAMPYDYNPAAPEPTVWLRFLESLWGDYQENTLTLQEWFGYCTIPDNRYQKMMFLVGPTRAGKGVILRTLTALVGGGRSATSITLAGLASQFGLQGLVGSLITQITDARFGGNRAESAAVLERILSITGGDLIPIDRKHMTSVFMQLTTRLTIASNELPEIRDSSAAFVTRFIVLDFVRTFEDNPDATLSDRIAEEMPGVFNWAYAGLKRLRQRGRFLQPSRAKSHLNELKDLTSPVSVFLRDECVFEPGSTISKRELFDAYIKHVSEHGRTFKANMEQFSKELGSAWPERETASVRVGDGEKRVRVWVGIRLKTPDELAQG